MHAMPPSSPPGPPLSVILCTYNPRPDLIARALRALACQTLPVDRYELIIVDNNSSPALVAGDLERLALRELTVLRETRQGLTFARDCGIRRSRAPVICFVDDDNELAPDYLERTLEIAAAEPGLGVWGGICEGQLERRVGRFKRAWLPHLGVRHVGGAPLTGSGEAWGPHEPIGAGITLRRDVAMGYARFVCETAATAGGLGRKGNALLSGEDSLMSRIAHRLGYAVGYRPQLVLKHHITAGRLSYRYLARLMHGHGRSFVTLARLNGEQFEGPPPAEVKRRIRSNFGYRRRHEGVVTALGMWFWDRGYYHAVAEGADQQPPTVSEILTPQPAE